MLIDVQGLGALSQLLALVIASILLPVRKEHSERKRTCFLTQPLQQGSTPVPNRPRKRSKNCEAAAAAAAAVLLELDVYLPQSDST